MKRVIYLAFMLIFIVISCKQKDNKFSFLAKQDIEENVRFKLFPTENVWTFLKLDTSTGKIWQVQYSIKDSNRGEIELNDIFMATGDAVTNGRFTLYPTKNMFNFILLDQIDGRMWQIQWSIEEENRVVLAM